MRLEELRTRTYKKLGENPHAIVYLALPTTNRSKRPRSRMFHKSSPLGTIQETLGDEDYVSYSAWEVYRWTFWYSTMRERCRQAEEDFSARFLENYSPPQNP